MKSMSAQDFSRVANHIEQARAILRTTIYKLNERASQEELGRVYLKLGLAHMGLDAACKEQCDADLESLRADACTHCSALPSEQVPDWQQHNPDTCYDWNNIGNQCCVCGAHVVTKQAMAYAGPEEPDIDF